MRTLRTVKVFIKLLGARLIIKTSEHKVELPMLLNATGGGAVCLSTHQEYPLICSTHGSRRIRYYHSRSELLTCVHMSYYKS